MRPALRKETALSPTPHQHQRAGAGRHTHSPPGTPDGWRLGGCPLRCRLLRNSRSARNRTFRPLSVGVVPGAYSRHIPPGSPAGGLWPGLPAGGRLGDRLLHPHGKYCRAFANVRISTGFGGILTVEAKYYYEYIKQFISRRSPQQTQRCAQHSRKKHGAYGRQRCAARSRPTAHASAAGRQPSSAAVLHAAGADALRQRRVGISAHGGQQAGKQGRIPPGIMQKGSVWSPLRKEVINPTSAEMTSIGFCP